VCLDIRANGRRINEDLDSQGPPERFAPHR
jgi:hypothetical protein